VRDKYDFDGVSYITELDEYVAHFAQCKAGKIFLLHNYQAPRNIPVDAGFFDRKASGAFDCQFDCARLKPAMDAARAIKSPYEIKSIRQANTITTQAHTNVLRRIKHLDNEAEIEAIFTATCIANQAKEQAYGVIAGSGANASTLHYIANNEPLQDRQLVCLDAGCEWECYASDVTRTFPISGKFSKEAKEIYDLVAKMQEECIKMVKPGANYRDIHMHAHKVATKGLMKLGLLKGKFEELYVAGASVAFFPHGLGRKFSR
jgi:Xaa-Pro dipeptidase